MEQTQLLTTIDNPINPFTHWDDWFNYDRSLGHDTCGLLSRVTQTGDSFEDGGIEEAMREIVRYNLSEKHVIVTPDTFDQLITQPS